MTALDGFTCCVCGSVDLISIEPGDAPITSETGIVLVAHRPACGWCFRCAPWLRGFEADLFAETPAKRP